jgi:hypothetical protein
MRRASRRSKVLWAFALSLLTASPVLATDEDWPEPDSDPEPESEPQSLPAGFSGEGLVGFGFQLDGRGNALGPGAGLRAGYTFGSRLFLGASAAYHAGAVEDDGTFVPVELEAGVDLPWARSTVRPYLGLGLALVRGPTLFLCPAGDRSRCVPAEGSSDGSLLATLGVRFTYPLAEILQLGLDTRLHLMPDQGYPGGVDDGVTTPAWNLRSALAFLAVVAARL